MKHSLRFLLALALVALVLPLSADAQRDEITLELPPSLLGSENVDGPDLEVCDNLHEISPDWCTNWHVIAVIRVKKATLLGAELHLENDREALKGTVTGVYRQFHLDDGKIVERNTSNTEANPVGEDWNLVKPYSQEAITVFSWKDTDQNGELSDGDSLLFSDGTSAAVETSRIGVKVSTDSVKGEG